MIDHSGNGNGIAIENVAQSALLFASDILPFLETIMQLLNGNDFDSFPKDMFASDLHCQMNVSWSSLKKSNVPGPY